MAVADGQRRRAARGVRGRPAGGDEAGAPVAGRACAAALDDAHCARGQKQPLQDTPDVQLPHLHDSHGCAFKTCCTNCRHLSGTAPGGSGSHFRQPRTAGPPAGQEHMQGDVLCVRFCQGFSWFSRQQPCQQAPHVQLAHLDSREGMVHICHCCDRSPAASRAQDAASLVTHC